MKDGHFYQVSGWMGRRLGLRGNNLICFAIIYGFSQDGESQFKGTVDYLCDWMFCSRPTALLCLENLINLDLISKEEATVNGKKRCYYATKVFFDDGELKCIDTSKEPLPMTSKEPLPNNNSNNNKEKSLSKDRHKKEVPIGTTHTEEELTFIKKMKEKFPRIMRMEQPLTLEQAKILKKKYGRDLLAKIMLEVEDWRPLIKNKVSAYLTINNWCRKEMDRL